MARKTKKVTHSVTVNPEIKERFREVCEEQDMNQSTLIEAFMRAYVNGKVVLELVNNKMEAKIKE